MNNKTYTVGDYVWLKIGLLCRIRKKYPDNTWYVIKVKDAIRKGLAIGNLQIARKANVKMKWNKI